MSSGATFTMRLKDVLEATGGTREVINGISVITGGDIGLNHYPIFTDDETVNLPDYRPILNGKIFDHYMNQEIGFESIGIFQQKMRSTMNEIMPFYNQMYKSTLIEIVPIRTTDLHTDNTMDNTQTAAQNGTTTSTTNSSGRARSVNSDTPQTMLSGDEDYASAAADTNSANTSAATGEQVTTASTTDNASGATNIIGYQGAASDLLMRYRESFINPDMMVINDANIAQLFMGLWDNGDSYTNNNGRFYL